MDLLNKLQKIIGFQLSTFERLNKTKGICTFVKWDIENQCFYYKFKAKESNKFNQKIVSIPELEKLMWVLQKKKIIYRPDFVSCCKTTNKSGGCGFAVMVRIIEYLKIGKYQGHGKGVILINKTK